MTILIHSKGGYMTYLLVACLTCNMANVVLTYNTAKLFGIPEDLFTAVIYTESGFVTKAVNNQAPIASYGLGQLTKNTAWDECRLSMKNIMDPKKNLKCSAKVLSNKLVRYHQNWGMALSAYNAGSYTLKNKKYVMDVLDEVDKIEGGYGL